MNPPKPRNPRSQPPRLLPNEPLPPYTFVPGRTPHPHSDPQGHAFGLPPEPPEMLDDVRWRECGPYLRGLDLFNHGYCWEAHEVWEGLWNTAGRRGPLADFLKGLIKLAAAGVKARAGQPEGVRHHARRAAQLFHEVGSARFCGLDLDELTAAALQIAEQPPAVGADEPLGAPVLPLVLTPSE